jgi:hypothetical protein
VGCSVTIRFLLDENRSPLLADAIRRRDLSIDVLRVGDVGAPPLHTLDPEVLLHCEREQRLLVQQMRAISAQWQREGRIEGSRTVKAFATKVR